VERFEASPWAVYGSNFEDRTYPDGLDCEIFTTEALRLAAALATDPFDREHVTPFMSRDPERFPAVSLTGEPRLGHLRWTVDTPDDLEFTRAVARRLGDRRHDATMLEILDTIRRPPALGAPGGVRA
jgi:spore coat polysaccharide biosynthesis protein SpsF